MALDIGQMLAGTFAGGGGGAGGEGLLGGKPGLLDLIPAFQYQKGNLGISFDPQKEKRRRAIMRLIEQQSGQRVPEMTTETAPGLGGILGGGGTNFITPRGSSPGAGGMGGIPGFRGTEEDLFPGLFGQRTQGGF